MDQKIDKIDQVICSIFADWESNSDFRQTLRKNPQEVLENCFIEMSIVLDKEAQETIADIASKVKNTPDQQLKEFMGKRS